MWKKFVRGFWGIVAVGLILGVGSDSAIAQTAPKLRYGFQKGRQYGYDVKIFAQLPDEEVTHQGTLNYTVLSATDDQFALKCWGQLGKSVKVTSNSEPGFGPPGFGGPPRIPRPPHFGGPPGFGPFSEPRRPEGTTFDRRGGIVIFGDDQSLPLLLGHQVDFIIEALPDEGKTSWDKQADIGVIERSESDNFFRPFGPRGGNTETSRGAKEQINYSVLETKGDIVRISKQYSIKTAAEESGKSHIDMTGNGEFEFDTKEGVIKSQSMKYNILVNEKNVVVTIPVTVTYSLLSEAVMAERKKKAEEAAAAFAEANKPKPVEAGEREKLLTQLKSGEEKQIEEAAKRLTKGIADDKKDDISKALCQAFDKVNPWIQRNILEALNIWATPDAEKTVIAACGSSTSFVRDTALGMLGKFKTANAAKTAARFFPQSRGPAIAAFKAIGPIAETYAIPFLKDSDFFARKDTCDLLAEIGGKKSLAALRSAKAKAPQNEWTYINHAIDEIEKRVGVDDGSSPAADESDLPAAKEDDSPAAEAGDAEIDQAADMLTKMLPPGTEVDREELKKLIEEVKEDAQSGDPARMQAAQAKMAKVMMGGKIGKTAKPAGKAATAKTGAKPKLHVWHDASGTYEVEAAFVKVDGDKVTIKRADGKTVTLAIKKLSKADQDYVEQQKNVPENPFE